MSEVMRDYLKDNHSVIIQGRVVLVKRCASLSGKTKLAKSWHQDWQQTLIKCGEIL